MKVRIPSMLMSYTQGKRFVEATGSTMREVLEFLDGEFPGIKFRFINEFNEIREHMLLFLNKEQVFDLNTQVSENDELFITQKLSGGNV